MLRALRVTRAPQPPADAKNTVSTSALDTYPPGRLPGALRSSVADKRLCMNKCALFFAAMREAA